MSTRETSKMVGATPLRPISSTRYRASTKRSSIQRLESTRTVEQLIYREAELDEVWRFVDAALREVTKNGGSAELKEVLTALRDAVQKVHDLVGDDSDAMAAAQEMRQSVFLLRKYGTLINR